MPVAAKPSEEFRDLPNDRHHVLEAFFIVRLEARNAFNDWKRLSFNALNQIRHLSGKLNGLFVERRHYQRERNATTRRTRPLPAT